MIFRLGNVPVKSCECHVLVLVKRFDPRRERGSGKSAAWDAALDESAALRLAVA
jgi:hypothetical protein